MVAEPERGTPTDGAGWRRRDALVALGAGLMGAFRGASVSASLPLGMSGRPIRLPPAIILHQFEGSSDAGVMAALARRMQALFVAPVHLRPAAPALAAASRDWRGRRRALDLLDRLGESHAAEPPAGAFHALIFEGRLVDDDLGEVVSTGWGDETTGQGLAVLGLTGVDAARQGLSGRARIELTAERAFKHLATALVFTTGYVSVEPVMAQSVDGRLIDLAPDAPAPIDAEALRLAKLIR